MKLSKTLEDHLKTYAHKGLTKLPVLGWPDLVVGEKGREAQNPYMLRWHLFRVPNMPRLYLHKFVRSDDDRALHDHPWWYVSFLFKGRYSELTEHGVIHRQAPSLVFHGYKHRHRVMLWLDTDLNEIPAWTLFLTGRDVRSWGFWCSKDRFIVSKEFDGCGE